MTDFLQNHQKLATVIVIAFAVAVVVFLWLISDSNGPSVGDSAYPPAGAHGQPGQAVTGGGSPPAANGSATSGGLSIRQVDFKGLAGDELTGSQVLETVLYLDINSDGTEEALVMIRGEGENRPLDWRLYGMQNSNAATVLFERSRVVQGEVSVQGPMLVESEGIYSTGDPDCCPSASKRTIYVWKAGSLVVSRIEAAPPATAGP
ncbi:MAG: hypothetical protein AABZ63_00330 [Actinomycetota bacterium]|mgnify:CR=1 FL=1